MPSGTYEYAECCPMGYTQINTVGDCKQAYDYLNLEGANWGNTAPSDSRPTGCFFDFQDNNVHFNPTNVVGNTLTGDDEVICILNSGKFSIDASSDKSQLFTKILVLI